MSAKIFKFQRTPAEEPVRITRDDAKVMLMLCADVMSDMPNGMDGVDKDLEFYNEIQEHLSEVEMPDEITKAEFLHILANMIEETEAYADLRSTYALLEEDMKVIGDDTKARLLQAYGTQCDQAPSIPEIDGSPPDGFHI